VSRMSSRSGFALSAAIGSGCVGLDTGLLLSVSGVTKDRPLWSHTATGPLMHSP
jgi:hypothetical protein